MTVQRLRRWSENARSFLFTVGFLIAMPAASAAQAPQPLIVGVRNVGQAIAALKAQGIPVRHVLDISNAVAVVGEPAMLRALPFVRYVEGDPPGAVWALQDTLPYGVSNIDAEVVWGGSQGATNVVSGQGGFGVKVAVIDTGVDCGHIDLLPGCFYGANFVNGLLAFDDNGHGTHVAGIIGARDNGQGVIGVAPEAELYAVKVLDSAGSGSWSAVAAGINWAVANNMKVINMSLGGTEASQAVADAVAAAAAAGVLVVSAAGNSGCCNTVLYPAKHAGSMAIAAVDQLDNWATFSSTGTEVDVAAPGVTILSTVPTGICSLCDPSGYKSLSGTSMASPHVAGVGALLISRGRSRAQSWSLITGTAKDKGTAGFDNYFGWGRVDALAAVGGAPAPVPESAVWRYRGADDRGHDAGERDDRRAACFRRDSGQRVRQCGCCARGLLCGCDAEVFRRRSALHVFVEGTRLAGQDLRPAVDGL